MKYIYSVLMSAGLFLPSVALAACPGTGSELCNPLGVNTIFEFLNILLKLVIQIGFPVIVLFIVFIGFRFVQHSASGNADELKKDKNYLLWALIGALLLLGAQAISLAIQATVNQIAG